MNIHLNTKYDFGEYLGKPTLPGLVCCEKDIESIFNCIVKSCLSLLYYHLENTNTTVPEGERKIAEELIASVENVLNKTALKEGEPPKTMKEVLQEIIDAKRGV